MLLQTGQRFVCLCAPVQVVGVVQCAADGARAHLYLKQRAKACEFRGMFWVLDKVSLLRWIFDEAIQLQRPPVRAVVLVRLAGSELSWVEVGLVGAGWVETSGRIP